MNLVDAGRTGLKRWLWLAAAVPALLAVPPILQACDYNYGILISCFILLYTIAVSGLDISFGYCGQISMGHAGFFAIGAYGSALLSRDMGLPIPLTMLLASAIAAAVGALLSWPASKLVFHFLSLATIAFGEIVFQVISHSPGNYTGNFTGLFTTTIDLFGWNLDTYAKYYYFTLFWTAVFLAAKTTLVGSRMGRGFIAIRENHHAADGMGINVRRYKVMAFATGSFYTAFAGALYVHLVRYISPDTIMQKQSVMFVAMLLFGGSGSLAGPAIGAGSLLLLNESIRSAERYQMLIYGTLLLIIIVAIPGGIYGAAREALRRKKKGKSLAGR
jgi:branched-chain amino acid transport system permease protein